MIRLSQHYQARPKPIPQPVRAPMICRPDKRPNQNIAMLEDHLAIVAHDFGVSIAALKGPGRMAFMAKIRQEFCRRAAFLGFSTTQIGRALGGRHHTTVLHLLGRLDRKPSWEAE